MCAGNCLPLCYTCCGKKETTRKRICNATEDESFDISQFHTNTSYYKGCDCVIFTNCTNTTITIEVNVTVDPSIPVPPIPPIPSGGAECNYECEDIRQLHIIIQNLTQIVTDQQNDIDMLIGKYQELVT
jgi:hypothetical protein